MCDEDSLDFQCCLNQRTINRLELHRADYAATTGKIFEHFFCPILFADEPVKLMRGHVVNEAYKGSSKEWVIQRKDVDGFFGGFFEGDFELLQETAQSIAAWIISPIPSFTAQSGQRFTTASRWSSISPAWGRIGSNRQPPGYQLVDFEVDGHIVELNVKAGTEQMLATPSLWNYETKKDLRIPAYVSLIKAAPAPLRCSLFSVIVTSYRTPAGSSAKISLADSIGLTATSKPKTGNAIASVAVLQAIPADGSADAARQHDNGRDPERWRHQALHRYHAATIGA